MRELTCHWCGATGTPEEFELDTQYNKGFWCPDCDGFTFFDPAEQKAHRILLLLEQGGGCREPGTKASTGLRKRLSPLRYPGGKSKLIDFIYERLRKNRMDTFAEVFAGGASLGLSLLDAGKINKLVLNDLDRRCMRSGTQWSAIRAFFSSISQMLLPTRISGTLSWC